MSSINGSCSQSHALIPPRPQLNQRTEHGLLQPQAAAANPARPDAAGNSAARLATTLNAPATSVPEANKGATIDIHV